MMQVQAGLAAAEADLGPVQIVVCAAGASYPGPSVSFLNNHSTPISDAQHAETSASLPLDPAMYRTATANLYSLIMKSLGEFCR